MGFWVDIYQYHNVMGLLSYMYTPKGYFKLSLVAFKNSLQWGKKPKTTTKTKPTTSF